VIQINPRRWDGEPTTMVEIADRRNELAGNLSLLAFESAWRRRDPEAVLGCFADDAELLSAPPFPDRGRLRGRRPIGRFVREHLTTDLHIDPTRKQVARDRITWTVRADRDDPTRWVAPRRTSARAGSPPCGWAADQAEGPSASKWNTS
jgi:hypothetical protein